MISRVDNPHPDPYDPVGQMWKRQREWWMQFLLTLMGEDITISAGESMTTPNELEPLHLDFERLESEPDPRRLAQQLRRSRERSQERSHKRLVASSVLLCASLIVSKRMS